MFTGFQTRLSSHRRRKPGAFALAMFVGLALLILLTVVQVAHVHAAASDADHCPLCIVMHSAVPIAAAAAAIVLVPFADAAPVLEVHTLTRYWHPTLFIRPPPAGC